MILSIAGLLDFYAIELRGIRGGHGDGRRDIDWPPRSKQICRRLKYALRPGQGQTLIRRGKCAVYRDCWRRNIQADQLKLGGIDVGLGVAAAMRDRIWTHVHIESSAGHMDTGEDNQIISLRENRCAGCINSGFGLVAVE